MAEAGVLEAELADKMQSFASMRNILVHGYLRIDHGITYDAIKNELNWVEKYIIAIERFL